MALQGLLGNMDVELALAYAVDLDQADRLRGQQLALQARADARQLGLGEIAVQRQIEHIIVLGVAPHAQLAQPRRQPLDARHARRDLVEGGIDGIGIAQLGDHPAAARARLAAQPLHAGHPRQRFLHRHQRFALDGQRIGAGIGDVDHDVLRAEMRQHLGGQAPEAAQADQQ
jgi:hypothetical protein